MGAVLRRLALAVGVAVISALVAHPVFAAGRALMLALSEENLPATTPTPSATASASGSPLPSGSSTPTAQASSATSDDAPQPAAAAAAPVPPPADLSNVPISAPVSSSSLDPLIEKTLDPSLSASLRITEEARQQIGENHDDEAIRTLGRALSIDASNPYAYFYLGRAWLMKRNYNQALTFFSRAEMGLESNPAWLSETVGFEGACYEELNRDQDAAMAYQRAVQLAPGNLMARAGYGRLASALPTPPVPAEEQPTVEDADQPPPEESEVRSVPAGEPLESPPTDEVAPPPEDNEVRTVPESEPLETAPPEPPAPPAAPGAKPAAN
ncbi:MAG TPA: hypothetical protein VMD75_03385 [Candidatus Binataceae bacterium]|nr:hypothetical protein [Candidatus Binataceae bacterium]